jgi:hypothetical protein
MDLVTRVEMVDQGPKSGRIGNPTMSFGTILKDKSKYGLKLGIFTTNTLISHLNILSYHLNYH